MKERAGAKKIRAKNWKRKQSKRGPPPERPSKRSVRPDREPNQSRALQTRRIIRQETGQDQTDLSKDLRGLSTLNRVLSVDDRERNAADAEGRRLPVPLLNLRLERVRSKKLLGLYRSISRQERKGPRKISDQRGAPWTTLLHGRRTSVSDAKTLASTACCLRNAWSPRSFSCSKYPCHSTQAGVQAQSALLSKLQQNG